MKIPILYDLNLIIIPNESTFKGIATITLNKEGDNLELNHVLTIDNVYIEKEEIPFNSENNLLKIDLKNIKISSETEITIHYTGKIQDSLSGLYRSDSTLVTHFQPSEARKVFPCIDSPGHKSKYRMKITVPNDYIVIFNTALEKKEVKELSTYFFKETPLISSYLIAFAIGKFEAMELKNNIFIKLTYNDLLNEFNTENKEKEVKLRIYTEIDQSENSKFALSITEQLINNLSDFFDYPFYLEKMDQIALRNFAAGAMENLGLITYRDSLLLFHEKSNPLCKIQIAETVAHELVHQWFGNLITPSDWRDIWLNEGFATFLSNYILTKQNYSTKLNYDFYNGFLSTIENGLIIDSFTSHPIISENKSDEIYGEILYQKSSSVIKMFFYEDILNKLKGFIKKYAFCSIDSELLLDFLGIKDQIKGWLLKKHFPLLTVKDGFVSQEEFYLYDSEIKSDDNPNKEEKKFGMFHLQLMITKNMFYMILPLK